CSCTDDALETKVLDPTGIEKKLRKAKREGCTYSCDGPDSMFFGSGLYGVISVKSACDSAKIKYTFGGLRDYREGKIGCWECDIGNGPLSGIPDDKRTVTNCVLTCPSGYDLQYKVSSDPNKLRRVPQLNRMIRVDTSGTLTGQWIDDAAVADADISCERSGSGCNQFSNGDTNKCEVFVDQKFHGSGHTCVKPAISAATGTTCPTTHPRLFWTSGDGDGVAIAPFCESYGEITALFDGFGDARRPLYAKATTGIACTDAPLDIPL
ncbi:hypothetical protein PMAYCL1PPCAC_11049, partial [Pristionchus mayeri]